MVLYPLWSSFTCIVGKLWRYTKLPKSLNYVLSKSENARFYIWWCTVAVVAFLAIICWFVSYLGQLKVHMRGHLEKSFKCTQCDFRTARKTNLEEHIQAQHLGKLFRCEFCGYSTGYLANLHKHLRISCQKKQHLLQKWLWILVNFLMQMNFLNIEIRTIWNEVHWSIACFEHCFVDITLFDLLL